MILINSNRGLIMTAPKFWHMCHCFSVLPGLDHTLLRHRHICFLALPSVAFLSLASPSDACQVLQAVWLLCNMDKHPQGARRGPPNTSHGFLHTSYASTLNAKELFFPPPSHQWAWSSALGHFIHPCIHLCENLLKLFLI